MEIKEVNINEICFRPEDLKITEDSMQVYKLRDSLKQYSQLIPVICYRTSEQGNLIVLDGSLIVKALKLSDIKTVFVLDLGVKTEQEALQIWCALNLNERPIHYIELAKKIKAYPEIKKVIAQQTVLLQDQIDTLEKILDFDWCCFAKAKAEVQGPDLFAGVNND